jgi:hypothetical protein
MAEDLLSVFLSFEPRRGIPRTAATLRTVSRIPLLLSHEMLCESNYKECSSTLSHTSNVKIVVLTLVPLLIGFAFGVFNVNGD